MLILCSCSSYASCVHIHLMPMFIPCSCLSCFTPCLCWSHVHVHPMRMLIPLLIFNPCLCWSHVHIHLMPIFIPCPFLSHAYVYFMFMFILFPSAHSFHAYVCSISCVFCPHGHLIPMFAYVHPILMFTSFLCFPTFTLALCLFYLHV